MPYIEKPLRHRLDIGNTHPMNAGELTYVLTRMILDYASGNISFQVYAEILGALEATKLELYRRVIAPYEDSKKETNGDVY